MFSNRTTSCLFALDGVVSGWSIHLLNTKSVLYSLAFGNSIGLQQQSRHAQVIAAVERTKSWRFDIVNVKFKSTTTENGLKINAIMFQNWLCCILSKKTLQKRTIWHLHMKLSQFMVYAHVFNLKCFTCIQSKNFTNRW